MDYKLVGRDFTPPDVVAKVTGRAKYAEDFRAEGMLFLKLFLSPMPHARVSKIDASDALKMKGVVAAMTADDLPKVDPPENTMLTNEPVYFGQPILAVAATDEATAANAVEMIKVDLQPLVRKKEIIARVDPGITWQPGTIHDQRHRHLIGRSHAGRREKAIPGGGVCRYFHFVSRLDSSKSHTPPTPRTAPPGFLPAHRVGCCVLC